MHRIARFLFSVLALLLLVPASATAAPVLFNSYAYETPRTDIEKIPGIAKGQGEMSSDLLLNDVPWAGKTWTAQFIFNDDKLSMITLLGAYDQERFKAVRQQLSADHFEILGIVVDEKALDLFSLIKAEGIDAFQKRFLELIKSRTPRRISYEYFMTRDVSEDQKKMANSMDEFLRVVDMGIVHAEVTQLGDGSGGPQALLVTFTCPVLNGVKELKK